MSGNTIDIERIERQIRMGRIVWVPTLVPGQEFSTDSADAIQWCFLEATVGTEPMRRGPVKP